MTTKTRIKRPLTAKKFGFIPFDSARLEPELDFLASLRFNAAYDEYSLGEWGTIILRNKFGKSEIGHSVEYEGSALTTDVGARTAYLNARIGEVFRRELIKSVRIFVAGPYSMVIPHVDYLELPKGGFKRIHVPLRMNEMCLNADGDHVYRMKAGEVWCLDPTKVHSGGSLSNFRRLLMVIDFDRNAELPELFRDPSCYLPDAEPELVARPRLSSQERESLLGLAGVMGRHNFTEIVAVLAKVHFFRDVDCGAMYEWIAEMTRRTGDAQLMELSALMTRYYLTEGPHVTRMPKWNRAA